MRVSTTPRVPLSCSLALLRLFALALARLLAATSLRPVRYHRRLLEESVLLSELSRNIAVKILVLQLIVH